MALAAEPVRADALRVHMGEVLIKLANTYPTLQEAVEEAVQNAIDSGATVIQIRLNQKTRHYAVRDNGEGCSPEKFRKALSSVGHGIKEVDKLGRFGIGLISPLGKCSHFTFTSCADPGQEAYYQWTFETDKIRATAHDPEIPCKEPDEVGLRFNPDGRTESSRGLVWWRTEVSVHDFTRDRHLSAMTMRDLERGILEKYSPRMRKQGVVVHIKFKDEKGGEDQTTVKPSSFGGKKLQEQRYYDSDSGAVVFRLYLAREQDRKGTQANIQFGELRDDSRFSLSNLLRSTAGELLSPEVKDALRSQVFEGEILGEMTKLTDRRTCFEKSDALVGLCACIERWYREIGIHYLNSERRAKQAQRYQKLGTQAIGRLEQMITSGELPSSVSELSFGRKPGSEEDAGSGTPDPESIGDGFSEAGDRSERGTYPSERKHKKKKRRKKKQRPDDDTSQTRPKGERGPSSRSNQLGLDIRFDELEGSSRLWDYDAGNGTLFFNITHPHWEECDKKDWMICSLIEYVALQVITIESMPDPDYRQHHRQFADRLVEMFVIWLIHGGGNAKGRKASVQT